MNIGQGKTALITGAASGLGLHTAQGLAKLGFDVVLTDRDSEQGHRQAAEIQAQFPQQRIEFLALDLSSLSEIQHFCDSWLTNKRPLDVLINNAGLFPPNRRAETVDGFELGLGVGFYGHFALTGRLLPALLASNTGRVVTVSSIAHAHAQIDMADPKAEQNYDCNRAYSRCKLSCLLFAGELQARALAAGTSLKSVAAHPGIARTQIGQMQNNPPNNLRERAIRWAMWFAMRFLGQSANDGAKPLIFAAAESELAGGVLVGPMGFQQFRGEPGVVPVHEKTLAKQDSAALWVSVEEQTGVRFDWPTS